VNNRGDIAGTSHPAENFPHPVRWSNGVITDLLAGNPATGVANAINDKGMIAGTQGSGVMVWDNGAATSLGIAGEPQDINKSGGVVGYYYPSGEIAWGPQEGFYYHDGVLQTIGSLGNNLTAANGVNDRGVVVGYSRLPFSSTDHAVVWENGVLRDLGTVGGSYSYAMDVTNHGMIVGWSEASDGSIWMFTAGTTGPLTPVLQDAIPSAVNDRGQIVGSLRNGMAFLYEDGAITDLSAVAFAQGGWYFHPFDINDHGWIAGIGYREGSTYQGTPIVLVPDTGKIR
jgi:probable HAF family extracellular repeat protein